MDNEQIALLLINARTKRESLFAKHLFKLNGVGKNKMKRLICKMVRQLYKEYSQSVDTNSHKWSPHFYFQNNTELNKHFEINGYKMFINIKCKNYRERNKYK